MVAPAPDPLLSTVVDGRYRIDEVVGQGGFGTVYAALHLTLGIKLALKALMLPPLADDETRAKLVADFMEEARTLTRLRHPNVVSVLDLGVLPVVVLCYGTSPYSDVAFLKRVMGGLPGEPRRFP